MSAPLPIRILLKLSHDVVNGLLPPAQMHDLAIAATGAVDEDSVSEEALTATYNQFEALFDVASRQLSGWLGAADVPFEQIRKFWREILYAAAWRRDGTILVLAVEHADLDATVTLSLRAFSPEDIQEISDDRSAQI